jgi:hypothetical protein
LGEQVKAEGEDSINWLLPSLGLTIIGHDWYKKYCTAEQYDDVKKLLKQAKAELIDKLARSKTGRVAWVEDMPLGGLMVNACLGEVYPVYRQKLDPESNASLPCGVTWLGVAAEWLGKLVGGMN